MRTWTVTGNIRVRHGLKELRDNFGRFSPIPFARVRVKSRKRVAGVWASWGTLGEDVTKHDGSFRIRARRDSAVRQFKVEVKLKRSSFSVYGENKKAIARALQGVGAATGTLSLNALEAILKQTGRALLKAAVHDVFQDAKSARRSPGEHDLGALTMRAGLAQAHGDVWVLFEAMRDWFKKNGVPFRGHVGVKYPHNNKLIGNRAESSYCNPFNKVCYIISNGRKNEFRTETLLHELMHAWAFRNSTGGTSMASHLLFNGADRGGRFNATHVVFHEAFAHWASRWVQHALLPEGAADPQRRPASRNMLVSEGIDSVDDVQHFHDGWLIVFNLLTAGNLDRFDFNPSHDNFAVERLPERCNTPRVPFFRVLKSFRANRRHRLDRMDKSEMQLDPFLRRIRLTDGSITADHIHAYRTLLDPAATEQPWELFCR